jgi:hypothetical protein
MRSSKRTSVATQQSQAPDHLDIGTARKQDGQQRIFLRTGVIDLIDDALGGNVRCCGLLHLLHSQSVICT